MSEHVFDVIIIGGGFGGISMAKELHGAEISNFLILEKGSDIAGIWRDNTYPGVRCDIPASLYSYETDPPQEAVRHPEGDFHRRYLHRIAEKYQLWPRIRLNTAVKKMSYDDRTGLWTITAHTGMVFCTRFVIPAVGMLHIPFTPKFIGAETYKGIVVHTAKWDPTIDLTEKTVAIIGTGPSAVQVIPEISPIVKKLFVFQRTPGWVIPLKGRNDFGKLTTFALVRWPRLKTVYRNFVLYGSSFALSPIVTRGWSTVPLTWWAKLYRQIQVRNPELRRKLTPDYPLGCKRIIVESNYYKALQHSKVELVTESIERLSPNGIVTKNGIQIDVDVIVYATGFDTSDFMQSIEVTGKNGIRLGDQWAKDRMSYLGMATPNFPNMLTVHAHGSFTASGSNIFMAEAQSALAVQVILWLKSHPAPCAIEIKPEAMQAYKAFFKRAIRKSVLSNCTSWYQDKTGRAVNAWPGSPLQFRRATWRNPREIFNLRDLSSSLLKRQ